MARDHYSRLEHLASRGCNRARNNDDRHRTRCERPNGKKCVECRGDRLGAYMLGRLHHRGVPATNAIDSGPVMNDDTTM